MSKNVYNSIFVKMQKLGILRATGQMTHMYMRFVSGGLWIFTVTGSVKI
jgi:hypothetical protein